MFINKFLKLLKNNRLDLLAVISLSLTLPLFLYNLSGTSLVDFDEAWFAEVARNIIVSHNPYVLMFNHSPFMEHPPLGFNLIALSFTLFGFNEFADRLPSALAGFGSLILLYFIGKNLFNRTIGFCASLVLASSVWFMFRARTGNLDTILIFFYLLTFYFALKTKKNTNWVYPFTISLALVSLVKSVIGTTIIVPSVVFFLVNRIKFPPKKNLFSFLLFTLIIGPWLLLNYLTYGSAYVSHIVSVGLRTGQHVKPNLKEILSSLTFIYLHYGIRKWYYPALISLTGIAFFIPKNRNLIPILSIIILLLASFLTNTKTEIWHLIPLYPFLGLLIAFFFYNFLMFVYYFAIKTLRIRRFKFKSLRKLIPAFTLLVFFLSSAYQIYKFKNEIKLFDHGYEGLAYVSKAAKGRPEKLYLDDDYFLPGTVFYSQKDVRHIRVETPPRNTLIGIIDEGERPFLLLTQTWKLEKDKVDPDKYQILSRHNENVLILVADH